MITGLFPLIKNAFCAKKNRHHNDIFQKVWLFVTIISFLAASSDSCCLLMIFANSLDPDQDQLTDLSANCLVLSLSAFEKKYQQTTRICEITNFMQ